ncbi:serine/threonine-protein kinase [Allostreptomyces psammosilenae]|nr:serine/threonine-protein kinase [Allostreptomyces psammosilenae]
MTARSGDVGGDVGKVIAGRYELTGRIGSGGMGTVWRAQDRVIGRQVAVKELQLPPEMAEGDPARLQERMMREARNAARVRHPGVVAVYDVPVEDGRPWIVMELVDGKSLDAVVAERGPLPPAEVARIGLQALEALAAVHAAGVLHRDIKPANILLDRRGRAVLTDFGIARASSDATLTATGAVMGSLRYLPPERWLGQRAQEASDLWALGVVLYELAVGQPPFPPDASMGSLLAAVSGDITVPAHLGALAPALERLLRSDPANRPTADQAIVELRAVAAQPGPAQGQGQGHGQDVAQGQGHGAAQGQGYPQQPAQQPPYGYPGQQAGPQPGPYPTGAGGHGGQGLPEQRGGYAYPPQPQPQYQGPGQPSYGYPHPQAQPSYEYPQARQAGHAAQPQAQQPYAQQSYAQQSYDQQPPAPQQPLPPRQASSPYSAGATGRGASGGGRGRTPWILGGVVLVACLALVGYLVWFRGPSVEYASAQNPELGFVMDVPADYLGEVDGDLATWETADGDHEVAIQRWPADLLPEEAPADFLTWSINTAQNPSTPPDAEPLLQDYKELTPPTATTAAGHDNAAESVYTYRLNESTARDASIEVDETQTLWRSALMVVDDRGIGYCLTVTVPQEDAELGEELYQRAKESLQLTGTDATEPTD